jgi:hypothetical protein
MKTLCFDLYHDGAKWIAKNDKMLVTGKTLEELDENIKVKIKEILERENLERGKVIRINMELDYRKTIPHWMWQYHPYYFYRTVYIELD